MKELKKRKNNFKKYSWVFTIDFNSGFIWDLKLIKNISFEKKLTNKEIDDIQNY